MSATRAVTVSTILSERERDRLRELARADGRTLSAEVRRAIDVHLRLAELRPERRDRA